MDFHEFVKSGQPLKKLETDFMLRVLDHIKTLGDGTLMMVVFLDGTEIERKSEKMHDRIEISASSGHY